MPMSVLLLSTIMPFYLAQAIGAIATTDTVSLQQNLVYAGLVGLGGVLANVIGFLALVQHEARVRTGLYTSVFNQLIAKDIQFFVNQKVGSLTSRFIDFVRSHVALQDLLIIRTLGFVISVVVGLVLVALEAPLLSLLLLVLIALVVLQVRFFTKIRKPFRHERKKLIGEIHGEAADSITNSMLVKTFAKEASEQATLEKKTSRLQKVFIK